jgi:hypothetical protein
MKKLTLILSMLATITTAMQTAAAQNKSPYISKVFDYCPAPGQHINKLPQYDSGDTREIMIQKVENSIKGNTRELISLGDFGGYVVFGFDHTIINVQNKNDFKIWGNAFSGSSEPGIVMVAYDSNKNGLPDDTWFELAGSEYHKPETTKNYQITYNKSEANYPKWISENSLVFEGTKLQDNGIDESGNGSYWVRSAYDWGYADNQPNNSELSELDIDWAVDKNGNPVALEGIDFVKVCTGVHQICGWTGEGSTDITGAEDLNFLNVGTAAVLQNIDNTKVWYENNVLHLKNLNGYTCLLISASGQILQKFNTISDFETRNIRLTKGLYILKAQKENTIKTYKIITP